jgi:hypothetical protein
MNHRSISAHSVVENTGDHGASMFRASLLTLGDGNEDWKKLVDAGMGRHLHAHSSSMAPSVATGVLAARSPDLAQRALRAFIDSVPAPFRQVFFVVPWVPGGPPIWVEMANRAAAYCGTGPDMVGSRYREVARACWPMARELMLPAAWQSRFDVRTNLKRVKSVTPLEYAFWHHGTDGDPSLAVFLLNEGAPLGKREAASLALCEAGTVAKLLDAFELDVNVLRSVARPSSQRNESAVMAIQSHLARRAAHGAMQRAQTISMNKPGE